VLLKLGALKDGTVYFSAPLYRPNLLYDIVPKPSAAKDMLKMMTQYILDKHAGESGIVYCFSKKVRAVFPSNVKFVSSPKLIRCHAG
jgi:ATP-dependent DNA helicase Q1